MGQTLAEKILSRVVGRPVRAGEVVIVRPAHLLTHDNTAAIIGKIGPELDRYGIADPELPVIVIDHVAPAASEKTATNHKRIREFVRRFGIRHFFDVGEGICHQVLMERGLARPGTVVVGSDSHTCSYGAVACFATGIDRTEAASLLLTGETWLKVPRAIRVELTGSFQPGVTAKDLVLRIISDIGADGANYRSVEFTGEAVARLSLDERFTISNMGVEMGAKVALFPVDGITRAFLRAAGVPGDEIPELAPDPDADYERVLRYELSEIEPMLALPHAVDNGARVVDQLGLPFDQGLIGTCTNGRLSDFALAARILEGRRVSPGVRLLVLPASRRVLLDAMEAGYVETIVQAGGVVLPPGCGPCLGAHQGVLAPGERALSTANRNFKGRMGCREAEIVLASPATVAASAIEGAVADPRPYLQEEA